MGYIVWQKHRFYCIVPRDLLSNIRQAAPTKPAWSPSVEHTTRVLLAGTGQMFWWSSRSMAALK